MIFSDRCPHCGEEIDVEQPYPGLCGGDEEVEHQQDCPRCGRSVVGVFKVEYMLQEVRPA